MKSISEQDTVRSIDSCSPEFQQVKAVWGESPYLGLHKVDHLVVP